MMLCTSQWQYKGIDLACLNDVCVHLNINTVVNMQVLFLLIMYQLLEMSIIKVSFVAVKIY